MRYLLLSLLLSIVLLGTAKPEIEKSSIPTWTNKVDFVDENIVEGKGGEQYLLIDIQTNIPKQTSYYHYAIKLLNSDGVQDQSDISVVFDPSFENIVFHKINIIRDGIIINQLNIDNFRVFQRENNMERSLYDGSLTAVLNLPGIRENDIIEYAYSRQGFNPINNGNYSRTFYHQHTIPVNHIYNRVVTEKDQKINFKKFVNAEDPVKKQTRFGKEYLWNEEALDNKPYETNVPAWFDPHKRVEISTYNSWSELVDQYLPLYTYSDNEVKWIYKSIKENLDKEPSITDLIHFVQNDIRYLGFESGISAYKPNSPKRVYIQRYGDCKDKSLLLSSLLRLKGVRAYPFLVNTVIKNELINLLPGSNGFNHCIVNFNVNGKQYFVDPTISCQGGNLDHYHAPDYKYGLRLKEGEKSLTSMPKPKASTITITEKITLDSVNGNAQFIVKTNYTGQKADNIRRDFESSVHERIQRNYLDYYSHLYPNIKLAENIQIIDEQIDSSNLITIVEQYFIPKIWEYTEDSSQIYCKFYPLVLESTADFPKSINQKMPYYLGPAIDFNQTTIVHLPEFWNITDDSLTIRNNNFRYKNRITKKDLTLSYYNSFSLFNEYIQGDSIETFLKAIEDAEGEYPYYITYNLAAEKKGISAIAVIIFIVSLLAAIVLYFIIYKYYNPASVADSKITSLGGWLILPLIGLVLTPFSLSFQFFTPDFFSKANWEIIIFGEVDNQMALIIVLALELIYNTFFISFSILLIILFIQKRTSLPLLMSIFYGANLIFLIIDTVGIEALFPDSFTNSELTQAYKDIGKAFIASLIWIPYFNISKRVKNTFHKTLK